MPIQLHAPGPEPIKLAPIWPSAGVRAWYEDQLGKLITEMNGSIRTGMLRVYETAPLPILPVTFPNGEMNHVLDTLEQHWDEVFDDKAEDIAFGAIYRALRHHDLAFAASLKRVGIDLPAPEPADHTEVALDSQETTKHIWSAFSVKFDVTDRLKKAIKAQLRDNVDLISSRAIKGGPSIPRKAFGDIRKMAKESVERGRSLVEFTKDLEDRFAITRRRASLIARDQNNKMTAAFHRTRQLDTGITEAEWVHTSASLHPREDHEAFDGEEYPVETGHDFDDGFGPVLPGEAINCGCLSSSIVPGYRSA